MGEACMVMLEINRGTLMNVNEAVEKSLEVLNVYKGKYSDRPSHEAIANLASNILVSQAIEKLAEAMSHKEPTPDPYGC